MTMPLIPPFAVTASYQKQQYGSGSIYTPGIPSVYGALVSPPTNGVTSETDSATRAAATGFTGHGAANEVQTITINGTPTGGTFFLIWNDYPTATIAYNAAAAAVQTALNALPGMTYGTNAVQSVTITGAPTGGGFTLTSGANTTASIPYNATNFQVQSALQSLASIGLNNVVVTGPTGGPWQVTFQNTKGNQPITLMTTANTFTGGSTPGVTVANVVVGVGPTPNTVVTGGPGPGTPYVVTFGGKLTGVNVNMISADSLGLTGGTAPSVTVAATTQGEPAFSASTNQALLNRTQQFDGMKNFYDSGSGNHF